MKKTIIMIIMALVSISAFGRTATGKEAKETAEDLYREMQGIMDFDSIYNIVSHIDYFPFSLDKYDYRYNYYSPIVLKEALNRLASSKEIVYSSFSNICEQVNYEMDYPEFTHLESFCEETIGTTELSIGQTYKRLNENYSGISAYSSSSNKYRYITTVNEIPFTYVYIESNEYCITYRGLEKDWPKYEEKINELIKVITTL